MSDTLQQLPPIDFPPLLHEIPEPPKQLRVRGVLPSPELAWLTVIGSRAYTPYGKQVCRQLIEGLRGYPVVIVSGLALGIDALAHEAALDAGLRTVAVPGSGLGWDVLYPRSNYQLGKRIVEEGGALLSEFDDNFKATPWSFIQRNRIMAGMSHATLIIEAGEKSGTMVTARMALDYNRTVLAVPGPITSTASGGTNLYIKLGATVVRSGTDILEALGITPREEPAQRTDLSEQERRVLEALANPLPRDELIRILKLPTGEAGVLLSVMELRGLIEETLGELRRK